MQRINSLYWDRSFQPTPTGPPLWTTGTYTRAPSLGHSWKDSWYRTSFSHNLKHWTRKMTREKKIIITKQVIHCQRQNTTFKYEFEREWILLPNKNSNKATKETPQIRNVQSSSQVVNFLISLILIGILKHSSSWPAMVWEPQIFFNTQNIPHYEGSGAKFLVFF